MGYTGPPALTLTSAFTQWSAGVPVIALVALLGGGYLAGLRRVRRGGSGPVRSSTVRSSPVASHRPAGRAIAFCGLGLGFLVYATMS